MTEQERLDLIRKNQRIARESGSMYQTEEIDGVEYRVDDDNNYFSMTTGKLVDPYYPSRTPTRKGNTRSSTRTPRNKYNSLNNLSVPSRGNDKLISDDPFFWNDGKPVSDKEPFFDQVDHYFDDVRAGNLYWPWNYDGGSSSPSGASDIDGNLYYGTPKSSTPRNTFWDDEPSEEVLTQLRAMNAIKGGNALIDKYNSLNNLRVPPSNEGTSMDLPKLNDVFSGYKGRTLEGAPGESYFGQQDLNKFWKGKNDYITERGNSVPSFSTSMQGLEVNNDSNPTGLVPLESYFDDDAGSRYLRDQGMGFTPEDTLRFNLGEGGGINDKTDWLGWAGIGTGLLQGAGGILDYFSNMKGLELTKEAMDKKYAADDRNYLAQATSLNNVIDTRKDYIYKTQGGRNTDFLKNIPV